MDMFVVGVLQVILACSTVSASVAFYHFYIVPGARVENGNILTEVQKVPSAVHCGVRCNGYTGCIAYNYNPESLACELLGLDQGSNLLEPLPTTGWSCFLTSLQDTRPTANAMSTQKSTWSGGGAASLAIDGNTDGDWAALSCTATDPLDTSDWWMVQLQRDYPVTAIVLWNRSDPFHARLRDLTVYVATTAGQLGQAHTVCGSYTGPPADDGPVRIDCQATRWARYLKIVRMYPIETFTLCEVEIIQ